MKKSLKTIGTIAMIGIIPVFAYWSGTTQAKAPTEVQTITETREAVPDGYIPLNECIPLQDVACCFINDYGYPCFEIGDITHQLDDNNNRSYADIMDSLPDETADVGNHFVNMRTVVDFRVDEHGLQLFFEDGSYYYWKR